jgi:hypothetical protein
MVTGQNIEQKIGKSVEKVFPSVSFNHDRFWGSGTMRISPPTSGDANGAHKIGGRVTQPTTISRYYGTRRIPADKRPTNWAGMR